MKLSRAVQEFLADNRARLSAATLRAHESDLHRVVAMVPIDSVLALTSDLVSGFQWCACRATGLADEQGVVPATL